MVYTGIHPVSREEIPGAHDDSQELHSSNHLIGEESHPPGQWLTGDC